MRGFRLLARAFGILLAFPATGLLLAAPVAPGAIRPVDLALAGILLTGSLVVFSALASASSTALRAASAFCVSGGCVAFAVAATAPGPALARIVLGLFLGAGAAALALASGEEPTAEPTSTRKAEA